MKSMVGFSGGRSKTGVPTDPDCAIFEADLNASVAVHAASLARNARLFGSAFGSSRVELTEFTFVPDQSPVAETQSLGSGFAQTVAAVL